MKHRGKILEKALRQDAVKIHPFTKSIGITGATLYNWFKRENLEWWKITLCADKHPNIMDAFPEYQAENSVITEPASIYKKLNPQLSECIKDREEWRNKYVLLMEKYTALLEGRR